jgi:tRNA(fMet)-specific endonuclease VapC
MRGGEIALDTNQAIAVRNDASGAGEWVRGFSTVYLPVPAIGELHFDALKSGRPEANLRRMVPLVSRCKPLPITESTAAVYAEIRIELRRKGTPIPENDIWIAVVCVEHAVPFATADACFSNVDGLVLVAR